MVRIVVWDISEGTRSREVAVVESIQMTNLILRDDNDRTLLYLNPIFNRWVLYEDGSEWEDWTVEAVQ